MICVTGLTASEILYGLQKEFGAFEMVECNLHITNEQMTNVRELILKFNSTSLNNKKVVKTTTFDGLKLYFEDDSWILIRPSGTEPVLRIFAEAKTADIAQSYIDSLRTQFRI